jgi:hypothetical protein
VLKATSRNQLSRAEKIILSKIVNKHKIGYLHKKNNVFWNDIQNEFKQETGRVHKTLHRVVDREYQERQDLLDSVGSREEVSSDLYTDLVDAWLEVLKDQGKRKEDAKKTADNILAEAETARIDRDNLMLPRRKKASRKLASVDADALSDTDDPRRELTAPPESPPKR